MGRLRELVFGSASEPAVGLFIDGPNVLREAFDVDLREVRHVASEAGHLSVTRCYLDHHAEAGLIQAVEAAGYAVRTTSGDVDVTLAIEATSLIEREVIDTIAIATRDLDFKPVLEVANERGCETIIIVPADEGRSDGLAAVADRVIDLTAVDETF